MASTSPTTDNGRTIAGMYQAFGRGDVVVTGRVVAHTRTGRKLDAPYAHVFSFRDGKVSRNDNFHDTALWATALG
jgi:ketosteroid isomerase-like protein